MALPRIAFARLPVALQSPPSLGHRRHDFHARWNGAVAHVDSARREGAAQETDKESLITRHFSSPGSLAPACGRRCSCVTLRPCLREGQEKGERRKEEPRYGEEKLLPSPFFCPFVSVKVLIVPHH